MSDQEPKDAAGPGLSAALTAAMAAACGFAVANIYYNQPILPLLGETFGADSERVSLVPTLTQLGYALGLLLLVPLGDMVDRKRLILVQCAGLVVALLAASQAPSLGFLVGASVVFALLSSLAQQIIPMAAELARPEARGRIVGMVMSGLLAGILLARTVSGFVSEHLGWRAMFAIAAAVMAVVGLALAFILPRMAPAPGHRYGALMRSLATIFAGYPLLRRSSAIQACQFGAFSAVWATLAHYLAGPPFGMGSDVAGLFGVIGAAGVLAAPVAGRVADKSGPMAVIGFGLSASLLAYALMFFLRGLPGLVIGIFLFDLGVQASMIANQARVYALDPTARSRINTIFMTSLFIGGAIGSAGGSLAWAQWGWSGVTGFCFVLIAVALVLHALPVRRA